MSFPLAPSRSHTMSEEPCPLAAAPSPLQRTQACGRPPGSCRIHTVSHVLEHALVGHEKVTIFEASLTTKVTKVLGFKVSVEDTATVTEVNALQDLVKVAL
ncbi:hypothetical protein F7725_024544 [Dissostichus mawsoni]|uniref:Uncharacterized protein n=1 Tax=Dissostichus mawsoni TaxID=36200 RepID=A0A7J5Y0K1_DISMA|nr:hypothetical protein F7725_024544 [Dissostichus mawsoni]